MYFISRMQYRVCGGVMVGTTWCPYETLDSEPYITLHSWRRRYPNPDAARTPTVALICHNCETLIKASEYEFVSTMRSAMKAITATPTTTSIRTHCPSITLAVSYKFGSRLMSMLAPGSVLSLCSTMLAPSRTRRLRR